LRLFVALDLGEDVVATLDAWGRSVAREGLRLLPPASLHVTLAFLGERPDDEAAAIGEATLACAQPVPGLRLDDADWLGRGTALSVDLADGSGACGRLQAAVAGALSDLGVFTPETRAFRPHVTVARVRRGARVARELPAPPDAGTFAGTALTLYESVLSPRGASYRAVARADLPR
jgi:2'-5' RNA ligase